MEVKMNAEPNFFLVNRGFLNSDRWLSEPFTRGQAWVDLFGLAQHSPGFFRIRGIRIDVQRGQLAYSKLTLSKRWKWSRNKVTRYINELEKQGDLKQQNSELTTIITICKYDFWQGENTETIQQTIQQKDNRKTTNDTHTKNDNNDKNVKKENINININTSTASKKEYGNPLVNTVLAEFEGLYGFPPIDKKPRFEANTLIKQLTTKSKELGKEPTPERLNNAIQVFFRWCSKQKSLENVKNLSVIRRNLPIWFAGITEQERK
jgi:hypothetical protein